MNQRVKANEVDLEKSTNEKNQIKIKLLNYESEYAKITIENQSFIEKIKTLEKNVNDFNRNLSQKDLKIKDLEDKALFYN